MSHRFLACALSTTAALALLAAVAPAQSHRVSGDLADGPTSFGDVLSTERFTPDGSRIVYKVKDAAGTIDLYSVLADGSGSPVKLSAADSTVFGSSVKEFQITSDSQRVVFSGEDGLYLSSAPIDGSAPAVALDSSHAGDCALTPDGTQVVWLHNEVLKIQPVDGSAAATILSSDDGLSHIRQIDVSPDGSWVVLAAFTCGQVMDCDDRLFSIALDGSTGLLEHATTSEFALTADSSLVVFPDANGVASTALYSAPIDASAAPTQLSATLPFGTLYYQLSSDSSRAVFTRGPQSSGQGEIYSVPVDGSAAPVKLNGTLAGPSSTVQSFQITPDGTRVVYRADQQVATRFDLFWVPIAGGAWTKINDLLVGGGDVVSFQVSPDSIGVAFVADRTVNDVFKLYGAPYTGGVFQLSADGVAGSSVDDFQFTPDDARVVYRADLLVVERFELFSVAITGGPSIRLNAPPIPEGDVPHGGWLVSPDSSRVAYVADHEIDEVVDLHSAPVAAANSSVRLNERLDGPSIGDVVAHAVTPDGTTAVYLAHGDTEGVLELYSAPVAGGSEIKLNAPLFPGGNVNRLRLTPDGTRVLYLAEQDSDQQELFSVPTDGSQLPLKLNHALPASEHIVTLDVTPDGTRALFMVTTGGGLAKLYSVPVTGGAVVHLNPGADAYFNDANGISPDSEHVVYTRANGDLYSAPTDGSHAAVRLNARFGSSVSGNNRGFAISPDGKRVVYRMEVRAFGRYELFSVPIDGIGKSVRLNDPLPAFCEVTAFEIDATGDRVVYVADQAADFRYELFSVPIEGVHKWTVDRSVPFQGRVKLSGVLPPGGSVAGFDVSPDGSHVVFSKSDGAGHHPLFTTAIDGSGTPVALNSAGPYGGDFRYSPDGQRVVYQAFNVTTPLGVYSVLADGSQPPVALILMPTNRQSGFRPFTLSPDSKWVVYRADIDVKNEFELYARPIDGSQSVIQLNGPLVGQWGDGGDVGGEDGDSVDPMLTITSDSAHVVYGADQESDEMHELFASPLPTLP